MIIDYLENLLDIEGLCQELGKLVEERYYKKDGSLKERGIKGNFCYYPAYLQRYGAVIGAVEVSDFLGIKYLEKNKLIVDRWIELLREPTRLTLKSNFERGLNHIKKVFKEVKDEIEQMLSRLHPLEMDRLNEAVHCFIEGCYYSSVAMAVFAIEFRLFSLMMSMCPKSKLEELTLGQLIREYLDNKEKYGNVIPKKHEPLLDHCNTYRIFSVHPKKEKISKPIASSILNMTFLFLLDEKLAKKVEEAEAS